MELDYIFIFSAIISRAQDDARGMFKSGTVYDDANAEQLDTFDHKQPHRNGNLEILEADEEGYIKSYIVAPDTIFGIATGKFVQMGLQNSHSMALPFMIMSEKSHSACNGMVHM
ncbi:hypothetical protein C8J57DRAFT_1499430 [Mycena rebaudengoi]|nr:hypothetical protein C8J57DRAFT_1499430 [Mycena rebaudengoi]